MRAARYFGATGHSCTYCRNRRFHTHQEHQRELLSYIQTLKAARRRRNPGATDFNAQCSLCLKGQAHTDGEHDRQVQNYLDSEGRPGDYDPDDFTDQYFTR